MKASLEKTASAFMTNKKQFDWVSILIQLSWSTV